MARIRSNFPAPLARECARLLQGAVSQVDRRRLMALHLAIAEDLSNEAIAKRTGFSINTVRAYHVRARRHGAAALLERRKGGRFRQHLSVAEESAILTEMLPKSRTGGVVVVSEIKRKLERAAGRSYHLNSIYRLLARHGWRKLAPRRVHPSQAPGAVDDFKKSGRKPGRTRSIEPPQ